MEPATAPNLLRVLITERQWTYTAFSTQFARAANAVAEQDGEPRLARVTVSEPTFRRWMAGALRTLPGADTCRVLEVLLNRPATVLFEPVPPSLDRPPPPRDTAVPDPIEEYIHMAARSALRYTTVAAAETDPIAIEAMIAEATHLASTYPNTPPTKLVPDLVNLQDIVHRMLESRRRPAVERDLNLIAALANGMLAKVSHDQGDPHSAMTLGRAAYMAADLAGHEGVKAWVRGIQSLAAYWAGWYVQAAEFARNIDDIATLDGTVTAWLPALEARAAAAMGDVEGATGASLRADEARERLSLTELDGYGGLLTFASAQHSYYKAEALVLANRHSIEALEAADAAVIACSDPDRADRAFGDEAGARACQAIGRIARRDLDGGMSAIGPLLELPPNRRIHGIVVCTHRVMDSLPPAGPSAPRVAGQIREALEDFGHTSLKALPR